MSVIIDSTRKAFEVVSEGQHTGTITGVELKKDVQTPFGLKDKIAIRWEVEEVDTEGKNKSLLQFFNSSLHEKATLRKAIKSILGKDCGEKFDVETLVGMKALLAVDQVERGGKIYANVTAILRIKNQSLQSPSSQASNLAKASIPNFPQVDAGAFEETLQF